MNQDVIEVSQEQYNAIVQFRRFVAYKQFKGLLFGLMVGYLLGVYL